MKTSAATDILWKHVKDCVESKLTQPSKSPYSLASSQSADCELCTEVGGGVLIKCNNERCKKEFHLDCAYLKGGLSLDENGVLSYLCPTHFKPVLFCSCHQKYDESKAMICCDECGEWYHCSCIGISEVDEELDNYVCPSCDALLCANKPIPPDLIERNKNKETLSWNQQSATKVISILADVAGLVCPIVDNLQLNTTSRSKYPISKITEAIKFLESPTFIDDEENYTERFDTQDLLLSWKTILLAYNNKYMTWLQSVNELINDAIRLLSPASISLESVNTITNLYTTSKSLNLQVDQFHLNDVESFSSFHFCISWLFDLYEVFLNSNKTEVTNELNVHIRSANTRLRKISTSVKDALLQNWVVIFQDYIQLANDLNLAFTDWHKRLNSLLSGKHQVSLVEVQNLVEIANGFPMRFNKIDELLSFKVEAEVFESELLAVLKEPDISRPTYDNLLNKLKVMKFENDSCSEFLRVIAVYEVLELSQSINKLERIPVDNLTEIISRINSLESINDINSPTISVLRCHLYKTSIEVKIEFEKCITEVLTISDVARKSLVLGEYSNESMLSTLKNQRVITLEEKSMEYLIKIDKLIPDIQQILDSKDKNSELEDDKPTVQSLNELISQKIEPILYEKLPTEYEILTNKMTELKNYYDILLNIQADVNKKWELLSNFVNSASSGNPGSFEDLEELVSDAIATGFVDATTSQLAIELKNESVSKSLYVNSVLLTSFELNQDIYGCISNVVNTMDNLSASIVNIPIESILFKKMKRFSHLCKTVQSCCNIVSSFVNVSDSSSNSQESISKADLSMQSISLHDIENMRELRNSIDRLSLQALDKNETILLNSIKNEFLLLQWRYEVNYVFLNRLSIDHVRSLFQVCEDKLESITLVSSTEEYNEIKSILKAADEYENLSISVISKFNDLVSQSDDAIVLLSDLNFSSICNVLNSFQDFVALVRNEMKQVALFEKTQKVSFPDKIEIIQDYTAVIEALADAHSAFKAIEESKLTFKPFSAKSKTGLTDLKQQLSLYSLGEFFKLSQRLKDIYDKYITNLASASSSLSNSISSSSHSFFLFKEIMKYVNIYYEEGLQWNEMCSNILPIKTTRYKMNNSVNINKYTLSDIEIALNQPIANFLRMPMHERIIAVLEDIEMCTSQLLDIVMPGSINNNMQVDNVEKNDVNVGADGVSMIAGDNNTESQASLSRNIEDISTELFNEINKLYNIQLKFELIPLELPQLKIIKWIISVYTWMRDVPYPPLVESDEELPVITVPPQQHIAYIYAKQKLNEGLPIIAAIPKELVDIIVEFNIINIEEKFGQIGFHQDTHEQLKRSGDFYEYLEGLIQQTDEIQQQIVLLISNKNMNIKEKYSQLQEVHNQLPFLIVQIDLNVRKVFEKAINDAATIFANESKVAKLISLADKSEIDQADPSKQRKRPRPAIEGSIINLNQNATANTDSVQKSGFITPVVVSGIDNKFKDVKDLSKRPKFSRLTCLRCRKDIPYEVCSSVLIANTLHSKVYCSDTCTLSTSNDILDSLVKYKEILALDLLRENTNGGTNLYDKLPNKVVNAIMKDKELFKQSKIVLKDSLEYFSKHLGKYNQSLEISPDISSDLNKLLDINQFTADISSSDNGKELSVGWTAAVDLKSNLNASLLTNELSVAAASVLIKHADAGQNIEDSSPRLSISSNNYNIPYSGQAAKQSPAAVELEIRSLVRFGFEEIIVSCLLKHQILGCYELGAIFALELEDELYLKHSSVTANTRRELNKKEYKKHQLMIRRNLKQPHNDQLILDIVKNTSTIDKLLSMSSQEFADVSTQLKREKEHAHFIKVSESHQRSMLEEMEAKRRETMNIQSELWRQGDKMAVNTNSDAAESFGSKQRTHSDLTENMLPPGGLDASYDDADNTDANSGSGSDSVDLSAESNTEKQGKPKSGFVDLSKRFITKKPNKTASDDVLEMKKDEEEMIKREKVAYSSVETPSNGSIATTIHQTVPKVLDLLKSSKTSSTDLPTKTIETSEIPVITDTTPVRLMCSNGQANFTLFRPGGLPMECTAVLTDRRVQGLLKPSVSIEGRTRISDLERFIIETAARGRKIIATCRIFIGKNVSSPDSGFRRFCDEFTQDRRAGISNIRENVQFYVIPPLLKGSLTILRGLEGNDLTHTLYGIIVSRDPGPSEYINARPEIYKNSEDMAKSPIKEDDSLDNSNGLIIPHTVPLNTLMPPASQATPFVVNNQYSNISAASAATGLNVSMHANASNLNIKQNITPSFAMPVYSNIQSNHSLASSAIPNSNQSFVNFPGNGHPVSPAGLPLGNMTQGLTLGQNQPRTGLLPPRGAVALQLGQALSQRPLQFPLGQQAQPRPLSLNQGLLQTPRPAHGGLIINSNMNASSSLPSTASFSSNGVFSSYPTQKQVDTIHETAKFCVQNGAQTIQMLKQKPNAQVSTPFLFETHERYQEFHTVLKQYLGRMNQ